MASEHARGWPDSPYKGLGYYTEADAPLFAGRSEEVAITARTLADWDTRLLLLHGATGCGKSSFLRAGLIPFLESRSPGMAFARAGETQAAPVLSVSSTAEPLAKLASALYSYCDREGLIHTPAGPATLNLRAALPDPAERDPAAFLRSYATGPHVLKILENLSGLVPQTLILIIDQGEEVLTVDTTPSGDHARNGFFEFLSDFADAKFDIKILVALRTEYLGRFSAGLRLGVRGAGIAERLLSELSDSQIKEAIARPTVRHGIGSLGAPFDHYRFSFQEGVIDAIVNQLSEAAGSKLPAVQIVCSALYKRVNERGDARVITFRDLTALGGVEGSIGAFLDGRLLARGISEGLAPVICAAEIDRWKTILHELSHLQPDGTVTTDLIPASVLIEKLEGTRLNVGDTLNDLLNSRLLREVNVVEKPTGRLVRCFGLGHDTLGLVLRNWKLRRDQQSTSSPVRSDSEEAEEEEPHVPGRDIALCLSGPGYRSALFHVGALWRLNELGFLPRIGRISGVSGGALVAALLGIEWNRLELGPDGVARNFQARLVEPICKLADRTIDLTFLTAVGLYFPSLQRWRVRQFSERLGGAIYGAATLQDLPNEPVIVLSATNLQTASLFRLSKPYLADSTLGRVNQPNLRLSLAVAASCAMPPILSPVILKFKDSDWDATRSAQPDEFRQEVHLGDGTIADHLGLEAAWNHHQTILVSDGGTVATPEARPRTNFLWQTIQLISLLDVQLRGLRRRQISEAFASGQKQGAYWSIRSEIASYGPAGGLSVDQSRATELSRISGRLAAVDGELQHRLINWGYAVCDAAVRKHVGVPEGVAVAFPYAIGV